MHLRKISFVWISLFIATQIFGQEHELKNAFYNIQFSKAGSIRSFRSFSSEIEFRSNKKFSGPLLAFNNDTVKLSLKKADSQKIEFTSETKELHYSLAYSFSDKAFAIHVAIKNNTRKELAVKQLLLQLGINTEMDKYPHWNKIYFPTMMRSEKNFFWGYLMSPEGNILTIASPDPVASWHHSYKSGQHRIFTTNLDLMHQSPLPERHPQHLDYLLPGEEKSWTVYLQPASSLSQVKPIISNLTKSVLVDAPQYTIAENENFHFTTSGSVKSITVITPDNKQIYLKSGSRFSFTPKNGVGKYKLITTSTAGKISEAILSVRKPWSWYLQQARINAIKQEQKGGSHAESWYGLFSMFLAEKYFPNKNLQKESMDKFNEIYPLMYSEQGTPIKFADRIQNTAAMGSLLADMYSLLRDTSYLVKAANMCDFLITQQDNSGAYRSGKVHYTSVIYIAKSILEVCEQEKTLAGNNNIWQQRYNRHFKSATRAIDELSSSKDNIETEGEMTYEDGMISCSYSQIAMLATLISDKAQRDKYIQSAEYLRNGHKCLSQLLIPDARLNGGSLRYWESQYDVLSYPNMMSSPHGWTAWRVYGLYYLYQLTGNTVLLDQIYNALGACVQLIDESSGKLRWGFCLDPFIEGKMLIKDTTVTIRENRGKRIQKIVGEEYISMISDWYKAKPNTWVTGYWEPDGGACDNDVHEIFKCLEETVLTNAFVAEQKDGSIRGYNCKVKKTGNIIEITPDEHLVNRVHVNFNHNVKVKIHFENKEVIKKVKAGERKWIE